MAGERGRGWIITRALSELGIRTINTAALLRPCLSYFLPFPNLFPLLLSTTFPFCLIETTPDSIEKRRRRTNKRTGPMSSSPEIKTIELSEDKVGIIDRARRILHRENVSFTELVPNAYALRSDRSELGTLFIACDRNAILKAFRSPTVTTTPIT